MLEEDGDREHIGVWFELVQKPVIAAGNGEKLSRFEFLLRQEFERACKGDIAAIKTMIRVIEADMKAISWFEEPPQGPGGRPFTRFANDGRHVDLALMMLDMGAVDNDTVDWLLRLEPDCYIERLKDLSPSRLERWVYERALAQSAPLDAHVLSRIERALVAVDRSDVSLWDTYKARIKQDLLRHRGPGSTRFAPGRSGNYRGRPRKLDPVYCYDGFLLEPMEITFDGKKIRASRADILLLRLTDLAAKGDKKIGGLILKKLMAKKENEWKHYVPPPTIVRQ